MQQPIKGVETGVFQNK